MTIKYTKNEQIAMGIATNILIVGSAQANIDADCKALHKSLKGKKLGTVKNGDAIMIRFSETLAKDVKDENGKVIAKGKAEQTIKNYCTAFRQAVNEGKPFSMNAYRASGKRGAKSSEANTISVKLTIKGQPTESEVATMLRDAVNAEKFRESYATLAAFLVDALDEYDGE